MPFKSEAQRRWLWMHKPKIAREWAHKYGSKPRKGKSKVYKKAYAEEKKRLAKNR